ncbi:MAG: chemotaxis protein CheW [Anaerolineae bacterium]
MNGEPTSWLVDLCSGQEEGRLQLVLFLVAGATMAVPVAQVEYVERLETLTPVPGAPPFLRGVASLRGQVVPIVDLAERLGLGHRPLGPRARVLVVREEEQVVGMAVDDVQRVVYVQEDAVQPPPPVVARVSARFLAGVARLQDDVVLVLNLQQVLTPEEAEAVREAHQVVQEG